MATERKTERKTEHVWLVPHIAEGMCGLDKRRPQKHGYCLWHNRAPASCCMYSSYICRTYRIYARRIPKGSPPPCRPPRGMLVSCIPKGWPVLDTFRLRKSAFLGCLLLWLHINNNNTWDRPALSTCPLKFLGQARSRDIPFKMLGTSPLLGHAL